MSVMVNVAFNPKTKKAIQYLVIVLRGGSLMVWINGIDLTIQGCVSRSYQMYNAAHTAG